MDEMNNEKMIKACIDLMEYCAIKDSKGFEIILNIPIGTAYCKFEFSIDVKKEKE